MAAEGFIHCDGLVKIYKVANLEVFALQGLDLNIQRGELLGIVGASGSGKSTLMNILGGLDRPSAGRIVVDGQDLLKLSDNALTRYRSQKVGFVWQQGARNLVPYLSALDNIMLPMTLAGSDSQGKIRRRANELVEAVGLGARRNHKLVALSGGEQQRVAIAVALGNHPSLLLADEPTGEVDTSTAQGIFGVFQDLNRNFGITTVIVSHDIGLARYVQRVVSIRDGKTSTETVRQVRTAAEPANGGEQVNGEPVETAAAPHEDVFEEVILLDNAGRLQVPRDYLEKYGIRGRVQLEAAEEGILIRPFHQAGADAGGVPGEVAGEHEAHPTRAHTLRERLGRIFQRERRK